MQELQNQAPEIANVSDIEPIINLENETNETNETDVSSIEKTSAETSLPENDGPTEESLDEQIMDDAPFPKKAVNALARKNKKIHQLKSRLDELERLSGQQQQNNMANQHDLNSSAGIQPH